jgi:hypothetical protein
LEQTVDCSNCPNVPAGQFVQFNSLALERSVLNFPLLHEVQRAWPVVLV